MFLLGVCKNYGGRVGGYKYIYMFLNKLPEPTLTWAVLIAGGGAGAFPPWFLFVFLSTKVISLV